VQCWIRSGSMAHPEPVPENAWVHRGASLAIADSKVY
jgi:hypothetical protein